ncbi:MAG: hypothetical protein ACKVTZ_09820 [Bacteroidia bacterium]
MKKRSILKAALFLAPGFLFIYFLIQSPLDKYFAFQYVGSTCYQHGKWILQRIEKEKRPIDIAFVGSSKTLHAIQDSLLETQLNQRLQKNIHVANLGYCGPTMNMQYFFVKELLKHQKPAYLFIEAGFNIARANHLDFGYVADWEDIIHSPQQGAEYRENIQKALTIRLLNIRQKLLHIPEIQAIPQGFYGYAQDNKQATAEELAAYTQESKQFFSHFHPDKMEAYQRHHKSAFVELAALMKLIPKETKVYFFLLKEYGMPNECFNKATFLQYAPLLITPDSLWDKNTAWMDRVHLNDQGARHYSQWIENELVSILSKEAPQQSEIK